MKKRGIASRVQRVLIVVLASVFFIELILLMDTQLTGNPVKGILDSVVGSS